MICHIKHIAVLLSKLKILFLWAHKNKIFGIYIATLVGLVTAYKARAHTLCVLSSFKPQNFSSMSCVDWSQVGNLTTIVIGMSFFWEDI